MFWFFRKKTQEEIANIKNFNEAIKTIKMFIATSEWKKADKAIEEIKEKEKKAFESLIEWLVKDIENKSDVERFWIDKTREKYRKTYDERLKKLEKLKIKKDKLEKKYIEKQEIARFKIRFEKIKEELEHLIATNRGNEALSILQNFLEENKSKRIVIDFYNKEKKIIQRAIEKERKKQEEKLKENAKLEALKLIWQTVNLDEQEKKKKELKEDWFFATIKDKLNFWQKLKEKQRKKELLDEVNLLIEEDNKIKNELAEQKLANIHQWLVKEIAKDNMIWYDFYWKVLWATKIAWDALWMYEWKSKYDFFIWDATGQWIRAWFIVSMISKLFTNLAAKKSLKEMVFEINNELKQDLKSRNFITSIFFEINKKDYKKVKYVWMWHEAMLVYNSKEDKVEKINAGWLAAWTLVLKDVEKIKENILELNHWDILLTYSDWLIETKSGEWENYWIERLEKVFKKVAKLEKNPSKIYDYIIDDIKYFKKWAKFDDDMTMMLLGRNPSKDIIEEKDKKDIVKELDLDWAPSKEELRKIKGKTKAEIEEELKELEKERKLKNILKTLDSLYYTWEILKLKQEAIRYIKEWFIDKKINDYLKKAIAKEQSYKVKLKEERMENKYNILKQLLKKWDYETVIKEVENIIAKDWNI